jgi:hypothetical protein
MSCCCNNHGCGCCEHKEVRYCKCCGKVYCVACKVEWTKASTFPSYTWYNTTSSPTFTQCASDYKLTTSDTSSTVVRNAACTHGTTEKG